MLDKIIFLNVGFNNVVAANRVIAIVSPETAPIKRVVAEARESKNIVDATYGRKTRSVIIMDNGSVVLSSVVPETICNRFNKNSNEV